MGTEPETWPPPGGQSVWDKRADELADVVGYTPDGHVVIEPYPRGGELFDATKERRECALDDLRPEYPFRVPEWRGTLE